MSQQNDLLPYLEQDQAAAVYSDLQAICQASGGEFSQAFQAVLQMLSKGIVHKEDLLQLHAGLPGTLLATCMVFGVRANGLGPLLDPEVPGSRYGAREFLLQLLDVLKKLFGNSKR